MDDDKRHDAAMSAEPGARPNGAFAVDPSPVPNGRAPFSELAAAKSCC